MIHPVKQGKNKTGREQKKPVILRQVFLCDTATQTGLHCEMLMKMRVRFALKLHKSVHTQRNPTGDVLP